MTQPMNAAHEPAELRDLPVEVRALVHAVDRLRDNWAEGDDARRQELWRGVHAACEAVWDRKPTGAGQPPTSPLDAPYGVIPEQAITAAARAITPHVRAGTADRIAEAALHAAQPHMQPLMPVVDGDEFDRYQIGVIGGVLSLRCPRPACLVDILVEQLVSDIPSGDLTGLIVDHEADAHGGWKPITCQAVDTPSGPVSVIADQPLTEEERAAVGELVKAARARHAQTPDPYVIAREALIGYGTQPYGDLRLNATRASAKVVTALRDAGLIGPPMPAEENLPPVQVQPEQDHSGPEAPEIDEALNRLIDAGLVTATPPTPQQVLAAVLAGTEDHTDETAHAQAGDVIHALHAAGYTITSQETVPRA